MKFLSISCVFVILSISCSKKDKIDIDASLVDSINIETIKVNALHPMDISIKAEKQISTICSYLNRADLRLSKFLSYYKIDVFTGDDKQSFLIRENNVQYNGVSYTITGDLYLFIEDLFRKKYNLPDTATATGTPVPLMRD